MTAEKNETTSTATASGSGAAAAGPHADDAASNGPSMESTVKVVIVDDEPINIKVVRKYLKQAGYKKFSTTTEATEAVDMIRREL
ncbi:MAG: hypothetical protein O7J95_08365, partial [Planctomycetota bacterium]|nr:hypothetical protein [Planctomycetota bacterium]